MTGRNRRRVCLLSWRVGVPMVAASYWVVYFILFSIVFAIGDAAELPQGLGQIATDLLVLIVTVLSFPFMFVLSTRRGIDLAHQVFGNDSVALFGLITLNSLVWGVAIIAFVHYVRGRRRGRPDHA